MGYLSCFTRLFLTLINGLTITICLVFIGISVVMIIMPDLGLINHLINSNTEMKELEDTLSATGLGSGDTYSGLSLAAAFQDVWLMMAGTCCVVMIIAWFGCCGGCCKLKCSLVTYISISSFFLILELMLVSIVYGDKDLVVKSIKELVLLSLADYKGLAGKNIQSLGWNFVMVKYKCCGLNDYTDFKKSNWTRTVTTTLSTYTLKTPIVCCDPLPTSANLTCAVKTSVSNTAMTGCFDTVWDASLENENFIAFGYCVGFGIQFVLIAMAIIVFMEAKKKNRVAAEREERKKQRNADIVIVEPLPEKPMKHYTVADPESSEPGDAVQAW
ncbi:uncharacterized protein LOC111125931 [Crassostrea virginica]